MGDMERLISRNNLFIPLAGVLTGILSVWYIGFDWLACAIIFVFASIWYFILYKSTQDPIKAFRYRNLHIIWVFLGFIGIGIGSALLHRPTELPRNITHQEIFIEGRISDIKASTNGDLITFECNQIKDDSRSYRDLSNIRILIQSDHCPLEIDDKAIVKAKLEEIKDSPNTFQTGYSDYLKGRNIFYKTTIPGNKIIKRGRQPSLFGVSYRMRSKIEMRIENLSLNTDTKNFIIAILLGDREYLDPDLRATFATAGVAHVLALSGMHTAIIGGFFLFLLFPLNFYGKYKLRIFIATILLWIYAFVSGMSPSTMRACCMITFYAIALILERKRGEFNALYGAALLILIFSPSSLKDVGFQLSCLCVFSLIAFSNILNPIDHKNSPFYYKAVGLVIATIIATAGSWVLSGYYFKSLPTIFVPVNILLLPILPFYVALALIHILISFLGIEFHTFGLILDYGFYYMSVGIRGISHLSPAINISISYPAVVMWLVGIFIIACYFNIVKVRYLLSCGLVCLAISVGFICINDSNISEGSFIVRNEYRDLSLSVMGKSTEERIRLQRYKASRVKIGNINILVLDNDSGLLKIEPKIDFLILSGGFRGNVADILKRCTPECVIIHPSVRRKKEEEIMKTVEELNIPFHSIRQNDAFRYIYKK